MKNKLIRNNFLYFCLAFFVPMSIYLLTLAPTVTVEDSGELITAAYTLGIPHPSGYPLYAILGKIFTYIPFGTIAWRVNLMSAFFGALSVALLYLVIERLTKNKLISFFSSLIFAFSPIFWSQCVIAEVYTINTFFTALLIFILLCWAEKQDKKYLLWFSFLFGLSLTNHTAMILFAPVFAIFIVSHRMEIIKEWRLIVYMLALFLAGLLLYFYIPLRAWQRADFNWGPITNWIDVLAHISRQQYNDFSPLKSMYSKLGIMIYFFVEIANQFYIPSLILALIGAAALWLKDKKTAWLTTGIFLGSSIVIIYLRKFGFVLGIEYTYRVYYLPAFLIVVVWLGIIINYLYVFLPEILKNKALVNLTKGLFWLVLISLPLSFLVGNYKKADMSSFWLVYDYSKNLLDSMEPNSVYYFSNDGSLSGDTEIFSLVYLKMVENYRSDIDIVSEHRFFYKDINLTLPKSFFKLDFDEKRKNFFNLLAEIKDRPLYTTFAITEKESDLGLFSLSNGYVHRIYRSLEEAKKAELKVILPPIRNISEIDGQSDYSLTGIASRYNYNLAYLYLALGQKEESQRRLINAFNFDIAPFNHEYRRFIDYRSEWLGDN